MRALCTMKPEFTPTDFVPTVRIPHQPFGKKKGSLSMPRPKKQKVKVQAVERIGQCTTTSSTGGTEQDEESAANLIEEDEHTREDSDEFSAKEARQEATELVNMARRWTRAGARAAAVGVRKAEAALRHRKKADKASS